MHQCCMTLLLPLDIRARDDSGVIYGRLLDYDYRNFVFHEAIRAVMMVVDLWQYQEGTWPGFVIVIDLDRMSLGHLTKLDLQTIQQFLYYLQVVSINLIITSILMFFCPR
ncbi:hypothetical protein ACJJTC_005161 [Scirpophaga incertulas]